MHRYSKMRAWRSVDFEEPAWKDLADPKKPWGIGHVEQNRQADPPNEQFGDILPLQGNAEGQRPAKKISPRDTSLQSAVRRVFSMRKPDPQESIGRPFVADLRGPNPNGDWQDREDDERESEGKKSFTRAECMKYSRIGAPPAESDPGGKKKDKRSMFRVCRRLLGMKKN